MMVLERRRHCGVPKLGSIPDPVGLEQPALSDPAYSRAFGYMISEDPSSLSDCGTMLAGKYQLALKVQAYTFTALLMEMRLMKSSLCPLNDFTLAC